MAWTYAQRSGQLREDGALVAVGYSGFGEGKNNPALQAVHDVGPIPRGDYHITGPECVDAPGPHGPYVLRLTPASGTNTHGRSGFLIHGDSAEHPSAASHGCIVLPRAVREWIVESGAAYLTVTA